MLSGREFQSWDPLKVNDLLNSSVFTQKRCNFLNPLVILHPTVSLLTSMSFMYSGHCLWTHLCTTASLDSLFLSVNGVYPMAVLSSALGVRGGLDSIKRIP